jgi:uncharacterized membrane protein
MTGLYLWLKAFHIIAIIAWMAGMLYLPRLFVYHSVAEKGSVQSETFKVMERRLLPRDRPKGEGFPCRALLRRPGKK